MLIIERSKDLPSAALYYRTGGDLESFPVYNLLNLSPGSVSDGNRTLEENRSQFSLIDSILAEDRSKCLMRVVGGFEEVDERRVRISNLSLEGLNRLKSE